MDKEERKIVEFVECPICGKEYKTKTTLNIHLQRVHGYEKEQAGKLLKKLNVITESEIESNKSIKRTCRERHGVDTPGQIPEAKEKSKRTCLEKYGVEYTVQAKEVKEKIKESLIENYGVDNPLKSNKIKQKVKDTNLEKYGCEWGLASLEIQEKIEETNMERYGVNRVLKNENFKEKMKESHFEKFGSWFSQTDEHHQSNYQWKEYILPSGIIEKVQGYEPLALDILLKEWKEGDIIISLEEQSKYLGKIWYELNGEKHRYFPDIFIKPINKLIEVKSEYTYSQDKTMNGAKRQACLDQGFKFEFWVFNTNHELVKIT
jgi:uncharacterized C2H2 Zn-finger protein